jgi:hypothetical protein
MIYRLIMVSDAKIAQFFESKNFSPYKIQKYCGVLWGRFFGCWVILGYNLFAWYAHFIYICIIEEKIDLSSF